jgi:hypothetical protein
VASSPAGRRWASRSSLVEAALAGYILTMLGDRMEMAHSIEGRVPFLITACGAHQSQPVHMKIHRMTEKYVLGEAVATSSPTPSTGGRSIRS